MLSWAEYVRTFPFTSSNSTKPGHFRDSDLKRAKPASGLPLLMYSILVLIQEAYSLIGLSAKCCTNTRLCQSKNNVPCCYNLNNLWPLSQKGNTKEEGPLGSCVSYSSCKRILRNLSWASLMLKARSRFELISRLWSFLTLLTNPSTAPKWWWDPHSILRLCQTPTLLPLSAPIRRPPWRSCQIHARYPCLQITKS